MHHLDSPRINHGEKNGNSESAEVPATADILSDGMARQDLDAKGLKLRREWVRSSSDDGGCECILLALAKEQRKG